MPNLVYTAQKIFLTLFEYSLIYRL